MHEDPNYKMNRTNKLKIDTNKYLVDNMEEDLELAQI
jgi:hypothetical protein